MANSKICRVCDSTAIGPTINLRETMFGTGEPFTYEQCADCRCLQIIEKPPEMAQYYPSNYYSYAVEPLGIQGIKTRLRSFLSHYGPAGFFAGHDWWEQGDRKSLRDLGASRSDRVLDIGCGNGELIASLRNIGFRNVVGADPCIAGEITHPNGVRVLKVTTSEIEGQFEIVMMHHSLEHIWDQRRAALDIARLLVPGGRCIVRIPTIDSWAWEEYRGDWVQLDPPRHFYLHSRTSIVRLLRSAGLEVTAIFDDSGPLQLLGSEKIRRGLPVVNPNTGSLDYTAFLPIDLIGSARRRAQELNESGRGDAIAVHARRTSLERYSLPSPLIRGRERSSLTTRH
jgi:SAM-dependent methyltransferase